MTQTETELRIYLACAGGMSTSLLVSKMQKAAEAKKIQAKIWATGIKEAKENWQNADVLLIGPQVRYEMDNLIEIIQDKIPYAVIDMRDYGMMNGEKVLDTALTLLGVETN